MHDNFIRGKIQNVIVELRYNKRRLARKIQRLRRENEGLRNTESFNFNSGPVVNSGEVSRIINIDKSTLHVISSDTISRKNKRYKIVIVLLVIIVMWMMSRLLVVGN